MKHRQTTVQISDFQPLWIYRLERRREKGQVEKNVRDARNWLWQVMPVFKDLEELNQWLDERCSNLE